MLAKNSVRRRVSTIFTLFVLSYLLPTTLSRSPIRLSHSARDTSRLSVPPLVLMVTALKFTFNLHEDARRVVDVGVFGYSRGGTLELSLDPGFAIKTTANPQNNHFLTADHLRVEPVGFVLAWVASAADARRERRIYDEMLRSSYRDVSVLAQADPETSVAISSSLAEGAPAAENAQKNGDGQKAPHLLTCFEEHLELRTKHILRLPSLYHKVNIEEPGYYALFFYNCQGLLNVSATKQINEIRVNTTKSFLSQSVGSSQTVLTTLKVRVSEYNIPTTRIYYTQAHQEPKSFLPIGDEHLPAVYLFFAILFTFLTLYWYVVVLRRGSNFLSPTAWCLENALRLKHQLLLFAGQQSSGLGRGGGRHVTFFFDTTSSSSVRGGYSIHRVHYFMLVLLCLKSLQLLVEAFMLHTRNTTGELGTGWDYLYYVTASMKGVMLFTCIIMLGTGYSTLKPFLSNREQKVIVLIIPLQLVLNLIQAVLEQTSEGDPLWMWWTNFLSVLDITSGFLVLLPLLWYFSMRHDATSVLSDESAGPVDGPLQEEIRLQNALARRDSARKTQFITFYVSVILFIYFTRILVPHIQSSLPFDKTYLASICYEGSALFFYILTGRAFGPRAVNSVFSPVEKAEMMSEHEARDVGSIQIRNSQKNHYTSAYDCFSGAGEVVDTCGKGGRQHRGNSAQNVKKQRHDIADQKLVLGRIGDAGEVDLSNWH